MLNKSKKVEKLEKDFQKYYDRKLAKLEREKELQEYFNKNGLPLFGKEIPLNNGETYNFINTVTIMFGVQCTISAICLIHLIHLI